VPEDERSNSATWISTVKVEGLHNRLNFDISLKSGVNVIYGRNGLGKTTLLHIIANISELDVDRFNHLKFKKITIENNEGNKIELVKEDGVLSILINGQETGYERNKATLSDVEKESIRAVIGERAAYLPAFRSVLERMRESSHYGYEERNKPEFETLNQAEMQAMNIVLQRAPYSVRDLIQNNVTKTLRCREWFGSFVPFVRYPSITDVVSGLSDEWSSAQLSISKLEQKQFETAFGEIFAAIAKGDVGGDHLDQAALLDEIKELVAADDGHVQGPNRMSAYLQLVDIAEQTDGNTQKYGNILEIYRNKLRDRKSSREDVLSPINTFQDSVNGFLKEKHFRIGNASPTKPRQFRESHVFVEPNSGGRYPITALSSGERQIVTMLYSTSRTIVKTGCCLIDEPELSLHIDWQRIVIEQIEKQHQGRQIIACTHSPEVGADHDDRVIFFEPFASSTSEDESDLDEAIGL